VDLNALLPSSELLRLGTSYGGWNIPGKADLSGDSTVYCAGAGEDISFDCSLAERFHCWVRIIDPTPRALQHFKNLEKAVMSGQRLPINNNPDECYTIGPEDFGRLKFLPVGIADRDAELKFYFPRNPAHVSCSAVNLQRTEEFFTAKCFRLSSIMSQLGDRSLDMLKMDIEGAEYSVIEDLVTSRLLPRLLLIEFDEIHTPLDNGAGERIKQHIDLLHRAGMKCVVIEGSNATFVRK
jgi:FkbM family methyltransferase